MDINNKKKKGKFFMYRSVPLCTLQFAVYFLKVLDRRRVGSRSGRSERAKY
jgi:hypothetical protein